LRLPSPYSEDISRSPWDPTPKFPDFSIPVRRVTLTN
jgi:hypothetical protein